jgi:hypothetical protein
MMSSSCKEGRNSWRGGSSNRIVTGRPSISWKIPSKSERWYWRSSFSADSDCCSSPRMSCRTCLILSGKKNYNE